MHKAGGPLYPVQTFVNIMHCILAYPGQGKHSTINMVRYGNEIVRLTSKVTLQHICNTVALIREDMLEFKPSDIGIHSIRSSFAMFLILNGINPKIVQIQGRWKSDAFMEYIRPQVTAFSHDLSYIMMQGNNIYTVPGVQHEIDAIRLNINPNVTYLNDELFTV